MLNLRTLFKRASSDGKTQAAHVAPKNRQHENLPATISDAKALPPGSSPEKRSSRTRNKAWLQAHAKPGNGQLEEVAYRKILFPHTDFYNSKADPLYSTKQTALILGVAIQTVFQYAAQGYFPNRLENVQGFLIPKQDIISFISTYTIKRGRPKGSKKA